MLTDTETVRFAPMARALCKVVVVSKNPCLDLLSAALDAGNYDVVFVESTARAYSQIKRAAPQLVILDVSFNQPDGFQVLSILKLDGETAGIPVIMYTTADSDSFVSNSLDSYEDLPRQAVAVAMN